MAEGSGGELPVIVVGGGIAGVACARHLHDAGRAVRLLDRGHRLGGRLAVATERVDGRPHPVDLGAPYFTVSEPGFAAVVADWQRRGLARPWTDRFATASPPEGLTGISSGPQRWSTPGGLRSLVEALAEGLDVRSGYQVSRIRPGSPGVLMVDGAPRPSGDSVAGRASVGRPEPRVDGDSSAAGGSAVDGGSAVGGEAGGFRVAGERALAVVLAMPDPQAARLIPGAQAGALGVVKQEWTPVLTLRAVWPRRCWPEFDGVFVAGSEVLTWIADSGRSHQDDAPVLVTHSTAGLAARFLDDPQAAAGPMLAELAAVLGVPLPAPERAQMHRWTFASIREPHPHPFALSQWNTDAEAGNGQPLIGVCGDGWGPRSRVAQGWASGTGLAEMLLNRLPVSSGASPKT